MLKVKLSKKRLELDIQSMDNDTKAIVNDLIKGFVDLNKVNTDIIFKSESFGKKDNSNVAIPKLPTTDVNSELTRKRLPNSIDEEDKNTIDLEQMDTEQLPLKQYKNFVCPNCGQGSLIKTLGELQTYCFREVKDDKTTLIMLNNNCMENIINHYNENHLSKIMPLTKFVISCTDVDHELYSTNIIEDTEIAITTDGSLECECPCCSHNDNFNAFYKAYKKPNNYFEYEPCILCGSETLEVIQKDKILKQCDNEKCGHIFSSCFKIIV